MITNGEELEENIEGLVEGSEDANGRGPKEVVIGAAAGGKTMKSTQQCTALAIYRGPPFNMTDVFTESEYLAAKRKEFQKDLVGAVYGVKQYINAIREDWKAAKLKPSSLPHVRM
jgi:hypothetical protein